MAEHLCKEVIAGNLLNLDTRIHKAKRSPYLDAKGPSPRHIIMKVSGSMIKKKELGGKIQYCPKESPLDYQQNSRGQKRVE